MDYSDFGIREIYNCYTKSLKGFHRVTLSFFQPCRNNTIFDLK